MASIDPYLVAQYAELHAAGPYGKTSLKLIARIRPLARELKPASILDYGCGQSLLLDNLALCASTALHRFDPAIPHLADLTVHRVDLVVCTDVLEHIPESDLPDVVTQIAELSKNAIFCIDTTESEQVLPDGSNAHCTVRPPPFWEALLRRHFSEIVQVSSPRSTKCMFKTWRSKWRVMPARIAEYLWLTIQRKLLRRFRP